MTATRERSCTRNRFMSPTLIIFLLGIFAVDAAVYVVPKLTKDNYDELTEGKTIFVRFHVDWDDYSRQLAPDWKKLSKTWSGSDIGLVGDIECSTEEGRELCDKNDIQGFPTLMYGDPYDLKLYTGDHQLEDLILFAKENLKPMCSRARMDLCTEDQINLIANFTLMSFDEIQSLVEAEEKRMEDAEEKFVEEMVALQELYQERSEEIRNERIGVINSVKDAGYSLLKSVWFFHKNKNATDGDSSDEL